MRGADSKQGSMLCLLSPETAVPTEHPIRAIKKLVDIALKDLNPAFDAMYASTGRPSIPPERLRHRSGLERPTGDFVSAHGVVCEVAGRQVGARRRGERSLDTRRPMHDVQPCAAAAAYATAKSKLS